MNPSKLHFSFSSRVALLEMDDMQDKYSEKMISLSSSASKTLKILSSNAESLKSMADWNCLQAYGIYYNEFKARGKDSEKLLRTFC
jgi:hypothetical protein